MTDPETPHRPRRFAPLRLLRKGILYCFVGCILLVLFGLFFRSPIEMVSALVSGWWYFLARTVPKIHWNWDLALMAALCAALVLLVAQWFLNWLWQATQAARPNLSSFRWPWKWTWCGLTAVAVFFLVGMSVGGIVHQIGWMASSPEPMVERKGPTTDFINLRQLDMALQLALADGDASVSAIRREALREDSEFFGRFESRASLLETYHVLLIVGAEGKVRGAIIFPRNAERRARVGCWYIFGDERNPKRGQELTELINRHRGQLVAL